MTVDEPAFLEINTISKRNLKDAIAAVHGYVKFTSMLWIRALGQPTPDGIMIKRWSQDAADALSGFCKRQACTELLLRVDAYKRRWSALRGGYLVPIDGVEQLVRRLNRKRIIAALLEPLSPYSDRYCLACVTDPQRRRMTVEIVGPGFDTSDLLRGDTLPHERFELAMMHHEPDLSAGPEHTYIVNTHDYRRSVEERLVKIGARLRNPSYPNKVLQHADRGRLTEEAIEYLRRTRQMLLLKHLDHYEPIPTVFLARFTKGVNKIIAHLGTYSIYLGPASFSGTFTAHGRFVFWDFFPADKTELTRLYFEN